MSSVCEASCGLISKYGKTGIRAVMFQLAVLGRYHTKLFYGQKRFFKPSPTQILPLNCQKLKTGDKNHLLYLSIVIKIGIQFFLLGSCCALTISCLRFFQQFQRLVKSNPTSLSTLQFSTNLNVVYLNINKIIFKRNYSIYGNEQRVFVRSQLKMRCQSMDKT